MATRERPADRGRRRLRDDVRRVGIEHRLARVGAGLSLRACAAASGASHQQLLRLEQGRLDRVSLSDLGAWLAILGLDLRLRAYPAGDPIRDRAQVALLERFRGRLHPTLRGRTEVSLPIESDLRAWDGEVRPQTPERWRVRVEAETRVSDGQALERKLALKRRDDPGGHVILLISDTRSNRVTIRAIREGLRDAFPLDTRELLWALGHGSEPGGSGIAIM
jgi:transcriptional regulator with XRE-family HTH domain